jgi:GNAT superfamily N-acetyltransferase
MKTPRETEGNHQAKAQLKLTIRPVTAARWPDVEKLFGKNGACAGCWCMWWRLQRAEWVKQKGLKNRDAFKNLIDQGETPGLLAYAGNRPVGWCALAPRAAYTRLERSRILKRLDEQPVWSVVCFFVAREFRRRGVTVMLLEAAVDYARKHGATIIEGYPVEPNQAGMPDVFAYTGLASAFRQAGFTEAARRSKSRPIMRRILKAD